MAVSVAAAYVNNDGGNSVTSGSFNVTTDDLLVVVGHADEHADSTAAWTISDNQTPDLSYTVIARRDKPESAQGGAVIAWFTKIAAPITGLTITLAISLNCDSPAIKVLKLASGDYDSADPVGAATEGAWTSDGQQTGNITPETSGTGIVVCTDFNQTGTPTSADTTFTGFDTSGDISGGSGYVALTTGVAKNADMNSGGTPAGNYIWFEIRAAAATGTGSETIFRQAPQRRDFRSITY